MPFLTVISEEHNEEIEFTPGLSVKGILDATETRVRSGCRGHGACGLCKIKIESGNVNEPEEIEMIQLSDEELNNNIRLACQIKPVEDTTVFLVNPAPKSKWKTVYEKEHHTGYPLSSYKRHISQQRPSDTLAAAIDLGTTNISVAVFNLKKGKLLARRFCPNPQSRFGSDVISRLTAAYQSSEYLKIMQNEVIQTIGEGLLDIATREGIVLERIVSLAIVGNTAMLAILTGRNYAMLLNPKYWMQYVDCLPENTSGWAAAWRVHPESEINLIRPLAGFVGSDMVAGIVTTGLLAQETPALILDVGTNSEMALWDGERLFVTSAAGGPAFEGWGISHGIPAEAGAIYCAHSGDNGKWAIKTFANRKPKGICGSGLVDIVSILLRNGIVNKTGKLSDEKYMLPIPDGDSLFLTNKDIDLFARAKSAIAVGIVVLCREAGINLHELRRICIGGAFGNYLDIDNAQMVGLLPQIASDKTKIYGNTALTGCADMLISDEAFDLAGSIHQKACVINLSSCADFEDLFLENLYIRPMQIL